MTFIIYYCAFIYRDEIENCFCRFINVNVGSNGRNSDGGIWNDCDLNLKIQSGEVPLPPPKKLPCSDLVASYHFIADDAFSLKNTLMKPYPRSDRNLPHDKLIYNYRLSRARRIVGKYFTIIHLYNEQISPL